MKSTASFWIEAIQKTTDRPFIFTLSTEEAEKFRHTYKVGASNGGEWHHDKTCRAENEVTEYFRCMHNRTNPSTQARLAKPRKRGKAYVSSTKCSCRAKLQIKTRGGISQIRLTDDHNGSCRQRQTADRKVLSKQARDRLDQVVLSYPNDSPAWIMKRYSETSKDFKGRDKVIKPSDVKSAVQRVIDPLWRLESNELQSVHKWIDALGDDIIFSRKQADGVNLLLVLQTARQRALLDQFGDRADIEMDSTFNTNQARYVNS
jgi:hypothetical protein